MIHMCMHALPYVPCKTVYDQRQQKITVRAMGYIYICVQWWYMRAWLYIPTGSMFGTHYAFTTARDCLSYLWPPAWSLGGPAELSLAHIQWSHLHQWPARNVWSLARWLSTQEWKRAALHVVLRQLVWCNMYVVVVHRPQLCLSGVSLIPICLQ